MDILLETKGKTFFRHETSISFRINGEEYRFTMIEKGDAEDAPESNVVDFIPDEDLPFELTDDMKDEMYRIAWED